MFVHDNATVNINAYNNNNNNKNNLQYNTSMKLCSVKIVNRIKNVGIAHNAGTVNFSLSPNCMCVIFHLSLDIF